MNFTGTDEMLAGQALLTLVVLSFLLERALALFFDRDWFRAVPNSAASKPLIAFGVSWLVCWYYQFDVLAALLEPEGITWIGVLITAAILAGGSAAAVQLVQQVWGFSKENRDAKKEISEMKAVAEKKELEARIVTAKAATQVGNVQGGPAVTPPFRT